MRVSVEGKIRHPGKGRTVSHPNPNPNPNFNAIGPRYVIQAKGGRACQSPLDPLTLTLTLTLTLNPIGAKYVIQVDRPVKAPLMP